MDHLYSVAQIRAVEQAASATLAPGTLMQRAGLAAAALAQQLIVGRKEPAVLVLAGPGNNGGDALEAAANLADAGIDVTAVLFAGAAEPAPETAHARERARGGAVQFEDEVPSRHWDLVIDGLFGIGLARPIDGAMRDAVNLVNGLRCPVLALDVPSGLDADTGTVVGPNGCAVRATDTLSFIGDKPGLHTCEGREQAGKVQVARLGIADADFPEPLARLNAIALFLRQLRARPANSHKGSFGNVAIVGGATGMAGAAILAARAALFSGAGRVYVATLDTGAGIDPVHPELMFREAIHFAMGSATLVVGPGMGASGNAAFLLSEALDSDSPLVLDADALNLIAADTALQAKVAQRASATILTPHPLEAARLLGSTSAVVQADRLAAAGDLVARFNATVVLKGSGTIIASPGGAVAINTTGNPGLATGGTGDVLAGMCGSLLAQGWPEREAALAAVWLHGTAADRLVGQGRGPIGLTAGELPMAVRTVLNQLVYPGTAHAATPA